MWRHPDFFQYKAFIHAGLPRVTCPVHGARTVWIGNGVLVFLEGFSLLCELHGAQVPEGRVEPLVVVPPHVPVDVRA